MSDLDEEELEATKKQNKTDTKILLDIREIDGKIKEIEDVIIAMTDEKDFYFFHGVLRTLKQLKKGNLKLL